jgi:hypothetical protein
MYDLSDRQDFPKASSVEIEDEKLMIEWEENPSHLSIFELSWLQTHAYDPNPQPETQPNRILWDRACLDTHLSKKYHLLSEEQSWMSQLKSLGFTVLENLKFEELESFLLSLGPIYQLAKLGHFSTVKAVPNGVDISISSEGYALSPHTDMTYISSPPVLQFLYCVENNASSGESLLVDGFRVARDFQQNYPEHFQILTQTPVQFQQFLPDENYLLFHEAPIIKLNEKFEVAQIFFSHKNIVLNSLPFDKVEQYYEAYSNFFRHLKSSVYQYSFRLSSGNCMHNRTKLQSFARSPIFYSQFWC